MSWFTRAMGLYEDIEKGGPRSFKEIEGPDWTSKYMNEVNRSKDFIDEYGFAVPSRDAIEKIKSFVGNATVLEIGAGRGLWAKLLQDAGITVVPTDLHSGKRNTNQQSIVHNTNPYWSKSKNRKTFTDILHMSHEDALKQFGQHNVLMMIWPPYSCNMAAQALKSFKGSKFIFGGEGSGGCTADDEFFDMLENQWQKVDTICVPQWEGIHDCVVLYEKK